MSKKYKIDNTVFEKIDSKEKAYWLGFLYADGFTIFDDKRYLYKLGIKLSSKDYTHVEKFKSFLNTNQPIRTIYVKKDVYIGDRKINTSQGFSEFVLSNKKIVHDIIKLGCFPKKSLILEFPESSIVPDNFINHFIRGYFDGDGCLSLKKNNKNISIRGDLVIVSTYNFLYHLKNLITEKFNFYTSDIKTLKTDKIHRISLSGNVKLEIFLDWLYTDSNSDIILDRKYQKYLELKELRKRAIAYKSCHATLKTSEICSNQG